MYCEITESCIESNGIRPIHVCVLESRPYNRGQIAQANDTHARRHQHTPKSEYNAGLISPKTTASLGEIVRPRTALKGLELDNLTEHEYAPTQIIRHASRARHYKASAALDTNLLPPNETLLFTNITDFSAAR